MSGFKSSQLRFGYIRTRVEALAQVGGLADDSSLEIFFFSYSFYSTAILLPFRRSFFPPFLATHIFYDIIVYHSNKLKLKQKLNISFLNRARAVLENVYEQFFSELNYKQGGVDIHVQTVRCTCTMQAAIVFEYSSKLIIQITFKSVRIYSGLIYSCSRHSQECIDL